MGGSVDAEMVGRGGRVDRESSSPRELMLGRIARPVSSRRPEFADNGNEMENVARVEYKD